MSESFTETTKISYGQNVKNSVSGVIIGFIIFLLSFVVLWNNEGNNVKQIEKTKYMSENAIEVSADKINRENDNKLIHVSGSATTTETLSDGIMTVPNAFVLVRDVEMYQWSENSKTESKDELGGSTTETTTYTYEKTWSDREIDSQDFKKTSYVNPPFPIKSKKITANSGNLGEYKLTQKQINSMSEYTEITELPQKSEYKIYEDSYYKGQDPLNPQIGDLKITYKYVPSGVNISIIGEQKIDNTLTSMILKKWSVYMQQSGLKTKDEMVNSSYQGAKFFTNLVRIIGWLLMFGGLCKLIDPLVVVFKFVPFVESLVGFMSKGVILLISLALSLLTIAIAWFAYRPVLSIGLLLVIGCIVFLLKTQIKPNKQPE